MKKRDRILNDANVPLILLVILAYHFVNCNFKFPIDLFPTNFKTQMQLRSLQRRNYHCQNQITKYLPMEMSVFFSQTRTSQASAQLKAVLDSHASNGESNGLGGESNGLGGESNGLGGESNGLGGESNGLGGESNGLGGERSELGRVPTVPHLDDLDALLESCRDSTPKTSTQNDNSKSKKRGQSTPGSSSGESNGAASNSPRKVN